MPLKPTEQRHLRAAIGYCDLEMYEEGSAELEQIHSLHRYIPDVLIVRLNIHRHLEAWEQMRIAALCLTKQFPCDPQWISQLAYATRRTVGVEAAIFLLQDGAERFEKDALIRYNLACY